MAEEKEIAERYWVFSKACSLQFAVCSSAVHLADESRHQQRSCLCNVLSVRGYQDNIFYLGFMRSHLCIVYW